MCFIVILTVLYRFETFLYMNEGGSFLKKIKEYDHEIET